MLPFRNKQYKWCLEDEKYWPSLVPAVRVNRDIHRNMTRSAPHCEYILITLENSWSINNKQGMSQLIHMIHLRLLLQFVVLPRTILSKTFVTDWTVATASTSIHHQVSCSCTLSYFYSNSHIAQLDITYILYEWSHEAPNFHVKSDTCLHWIFS